MRVTRNTGLSDRKRKQMKAVIVYYSLEGNTKDTAEKIAAVTGADLLQIEPQKEYPKEGGKKFVWGGKAVVFGEKPALQSYHLDLDAYDTVMIGTPVWASSFAPPIRTFLSENEIKGKNVGFFACEMANGAEKCFEKMRKFAGVDSVKAQLVLIDPLKKGSKENEEKIRRFCEEMAK